MDPVFRVLTIWSRRMDEAIYDTLMRSSTKDWFTGFLMECFFLLGSIGYLYVQFFVWGIASMGRSRIFLVILAVLIFILCCRALYVRANRRSRFLKAKEASRKAKSSSEELLLGTLFYSEHLIQYNMLTGKTTKLTYGEIHDIRYSKRYIFLLSTNTDCSVICLEKAGFAGLPPREALKWLAAQCKCRPRR